MISAPKIKAAVIKSSEIIDEPDVQYTIRVCHQSDDGGGDATAEPRTWHIVRRYSDFESLHRTLASAAGSDTAAQLPPLPLKRFFGRLEPGFLAQRQGALQRVLDTLTLAHGGALTTSGADGAADAALALFLEVRPRHIGLASSPPRGEMRLGEGGAGVRVWREAIAHEKNYDLWMSIGSPCF